jgi:hypothetical protein
MTIDQQPIMISDENLERIRTKDRKTSLCSVCVGRPWRDAEERQAWRDAIRQAKE